MDHKYKRLSPEMKAKVAIEALKGDLKIAEIASKYNIHPKQVIRWRDRLVEESSELFVHKATLQKSKKDPERDELLHTIGKQTMDIEYLKKKLGR